MWIIGLIIFVFIIYMFFKSSSKIKDSEVRVLNVLNSIAGNSFYRNSFLSGQGLNIEVRHRDMVSYDDFVTYAKLHKGEEWVGGLLVPSNVHFPYIFLGYPTSIQVSKSLYDDEILQVVIHPFE